MWVLFVLISLYLLPYWVVISVIISKILNTENKFLRFIIPFLIATLWGFLPGCIIPMLGGCSASATTFIIILYGGFTSLILNVVTYSIYFSYLISKKRSASICFVSVVLGGSIGASILPVIFILVALLCFRGLHDEEIFFDWLHTAAYPIIGGIILGVESGLITGAIFARKIVHDKKRNSPLFSQ